MRISDLFAVFNSIVFIASIHSYGGDTETSRETYIFSSHWIWDFSYLTGHMTLLNQSGNLTRIFFRTLIGFDTCFASLRSNSLFSKIVRFGLVLFPDRKICIFYNHVKSFIETFWVGAWGMQLAV